MTLNSRYSFYDFSFFFVHPALPWCCYKLNARIAISFSTPYRLNVKLLYLVRDPRGNINSRKHTSWVQKSRKMQDFVRVCNNLESEFYAAKHFMKKFPDRFRYSTRFSTEYSTLCKILIRFCYLES